MCFCLIWPRERHSFGKINFSSFQKRMQPISYNARNYDSKSPNSDALASHRYLSLTIVTGQNSSSAISHVWQFPLHPSCIPSNRNDLFCQSSAHLVEFWIKKVYKIVLDGLMMWTLVPTSDMSWKIIFTLDLYFCLANIYRKITFSVHSKRRKGDYHISNIGQNADFYVFW